MSYVFTSIFTDGLSITSFLISLAVALLCGVIAAFSTSFKGDSSKGFLAALTLLPPIVATVIIMVNGNIGTGVAVMGAFSLIRFRSVPGKARDIVAIFLAMTAGLACAAGFPVIALAVTVIISAVMVAISALPLWEDKQAELRITVPESLNFADAFEGVLAEYTKSCRLISVKTTNMGSMYKLLYRISMKDQGKVKEFIDQLRCLNGNLEISVTQPAERSETL